MPVVKLPIGGGAYQNIDEIGLGGLGPQLIDGFVDEAGVTTKRAGYYEFADLGTGETVDGLYWWDSAGVMLAVSGGSTWKITDAAGNKTDLTDAGVFNTATRVKFAAYSSTVAYGANGTSIVKIPITGTTAYIADGDAPTAVTHVEVLDKYLLANNVGTGELHWSDVGAPDDWSAEYAEAEAKPDNILAVHAQNSRIYTFGRESIQVFRDDGVSPWIVNQPEQVDSGVIAPQSIVFFDNRFWYLNTRREFVYLNGTTPVVVSKAMAKLIQSFTSVADCIADTMLISSRPFIVLNFPAENRTLAIDISNPDPNQAWSEWGTWSAVDAEYDRFICNVCQYSPTWNLTLMGGTDGKIYAVDQSYYDDAGTDIRMVRRTAHIDHGSMTRRKRSNRLTVRLKRSSLSYVSQGGSSVVFTNPPVILVRWRDNGSSVWSNEQTLTLAQYGDTDYRGQLTRLGSYYSRQWEFVSVDGYPISLVSAEEDIEVLAS